MAATSRYCPNCIDYADAMLVAWEAVAACMAAGELELLPLLRAANLALQYEARYRRVSWGLYAHPEDGDRPHPRFWVYWGSHAGYASPWEDGLVEKLAVAQVFWGLDAQDQEVLLREAWQVDRHLNLRHQIRRARRHAQELWYDHETPSRLRLRRAAWNRGRAA